jgi:hypothetical protein
MRTITTYSKGAPFYNALIRHLATENDENLLFCEIFGGSRGGPVPDASVQKLVFTAEERSHLRSELLKYATKDKRISGAAITGSAAAEKEDRWSDIDLAFGISKAEDVANVVADWTAYMYADHFALHHVDVKSGNWLYRVFFVPNSLQVDLAFVPAHDFRALAPTFRLVFGNANDPHHSPTVPADSLIGMCWLYALHARACIERGRLWQGEYMISDVRDHVLALSCVRHGLPSVHGRGMDQLPEGVRTQFENSFVKQLDKAELSRAFQVVVIGLLSEIRSVDQQLAAKLEPTLGLLTNIQS